jgi:hypothetical protein
MNPYLASQAAQQHGVDLHRSAEKARLARTALDRTAAAHNTATRAAVARTATAELAADRSATGPRATIRSRAGWTLVQIGLRLATSSADAQPSSADAQPSSARA